MHIPNPDPSGPLLEEFRSQRRLSPQEARHLAGEAASMFRAAYAEDEAYLPGAVTLLTELATHPEPDLARIGVEHLFPELVEWSADWFAPQYCRLYDRLFAQVIDICRRLPQSRELHFSLHGYGIANLEDMLERRARQRAPQPPLQADPERIKKVLVPSRVTIGAEVAVTSVILQEVGRRFPQAERVILGAPVIEQLFAGAPRVRVADVGYPRGGSLLARLESWLTLIQVVADELAGLDRDGYLIIDPDSRLTQLGLLPLTMDDSRTLFFESRSYGYRADNGGPSRIAALTTQWLSERIAGTSPVSALPFVHLSDAHNALSYTLQNILKTGEGAPPLVCVSFGIGGNTAKRIDDDFEHDLLRALVEAGARVLFTKGVGDEVIRAERHMGRLNALGDITIKEAEANTIDELPPPDALREADVIAWRGELGAFCGLISAADVYIGYDSGGQHIAAALDKPVIDIFVDGSIPMVTTRWTPTGSAPVHVIEHYRAPGETLAEVMRAYGEAVAVSS